MRGNITAPNRNSNGTRKTGTDVIPFPGARPTRLGMKRNQRRNVKEPPPQLSHHHHNRGFRNTHKQGNPRKTVRGKVINTLRLLPLNFTGTPNRSIKIRNKPTHRNRGHPVIKIRHRSQPTTVTRNHLHHPLRVDVRNRLRVLTESKKFVTRGTSSTTRTISFSLLPAPNTPRRQLGNQLYPELPCRVTRTVTLLTTKHRLLVNRFTYMTRRVNYWITIKVITGDLDL